MSARYKMLGVSLAVGLVVAASAVAANAALLRHTHSGASTARQLSLASTHSTTGWHRFRGRVMYANRGHGWFRMRTRMHQVVQIYTNRNTYWDHCGWGYMHPGYRVDVRAYLSHHHWIATHMQRWSWGMGGMMGWG